MITESMMDNQDKIIEMIENAIEKEKVLLKKLDGIQHLRSCKYWRHKSCQCRMSNWLERGYDILMLSPNPFDEVREWKSEWIWKRYDIRLDVAIDALDKYLDPVNTSRLGWFLALWKRWIN